MGDRNEVGYDERTLPILLALVDLSHPDCRVLTSMGIVAFYLPSQRAVTAVRNLVSQAEALRDGDPRFRALGIGLSRGPLIADFDWRGRIKPGFMPVGEAANRASTAAARQQNYREILQHLHESSAT